MSKSVIVIGAGIGGLSAAIRLAAAGFKVQVFEQNPSPGGKMYQIVEQGFRWDTGPSVLTMRHVLDELFASVGRRLDEYVALQPIEPLTRYFYPDGTQLDVTRDLDRMREQINQIEPADAAGYDRFLEYARNLHRIVGPVFIYDSPPTLRSFFKVKPWDAVKVDGIRTMHQAQRSYVRSPHLLQLLGRFATYVGASPYLAPATLNVIAHVELNEGIWYPSSGMYSLAQALMTLAVEMGVEFYFATPVEQINLHHQQASGITLQDGKRVPANAVVANVDVATVYQKLLPSHPTITDALRKLLSGEPSCSGFILLLGVRGVHSTLAHHNIFFSSDYAQEFDQIFRLGVMPDDPTIYAAITSRSTPSDAPVGMENWFILVNAPPLGNNWNWHTKAHSYRDLVLDKLASFGHDLRNDILVERMITPIDLERATGAYRGALYGLSSNNRWAAFRRIHNRSQLVRGLYFTGGTTHPGGGVPMVTLSGKVASQMLLQDLARGLI
jgi:phytoene desaturase